MAEPDKPQFAADEDIERAKTLWKENGRSIIGGVTLGLAAIFGYNYWQHHQKTAGENASILFDQLSSAGETVNREVVADDLMDTYSSSPYSALAAFAMAKSSVENQRLDEARRYLQWALDHAKDEGMKHIARVRLGAVLLSRDKPDEVINLLDIENMSTFSARYYELLGDAYQHKGEHSRARNAYQESLNALSVSDASRSLIQLKLDNINES